MVDNINKIVGSRGVGVTHHNEIIFDNGYTMDVHEYETYIVKHGIREYAEEDVKYYTKDAFDRGGE